ncbi:protein kinase [Kutzneria buriramensis]|uniref:Serine/threonine protein kinase n=1 Tax=Kutzneria buriramensis TaxID=1045776 RepID=A0A3E0I942_9PSEU|nr:protein kinase [Kutzneria buriramensis]REH55180.1 serine/threonine protein kinase [Kutzneria buriramensis]
MGRREQPVKPGPLYAFAAGLRELRTATGHTYRALATKAGYSHSALAAAASGESLPTLDVTLAYVGACGGDQAIWEQRWRKLAARLRMTHPGLLPEADSPDPGHDDAADPPSVESLPADDSHPTPAASPPSPTAGPATGVTPLATTDPEQVGPIRIAARLGAGAMGQVFLGRTDAGRPVAVKVVRADLAGDPVFRRRFRRELHALREVTGPHLALLADGDAETDQPWLATVYRPAVSLADAVDTHGPLPAAVVRSLAAGVIDALIAVHEGGIVHRDLKPSNVLLTADGVQVIDFGIAAAAEGTALTATGTHLGSAAYMAPEQAIGGAVGPAADVFALGSLLGYALTGAPPFGEGRADAVVYRVVHEPPELATIDAVTSQDNNLRALIRACLDKDPDTRPTPADLRDTYGLADALSGPGWLPEAVNSSIAEHEAAALAALGAEPPTQHEIDTAAAATTVLPMPAEGVPPAVASPQRGRRMAVRIGLTAAALAVVAAGLVAWRTMDLPAQNRASAPGSGPAATSTSTAPSGSSAAGSSTAASASTPPPSTVTPTLAGASRPTQPQGTAAGGGALAPQNAPVTFSATIGEGCPGNKSPQRVWDSGSSAWPQHTGADGCGGSYYAAASVKNDNTYYWSFATSPVTTGTCDVQVYVPTDGNLTTSANYRVYNGPNAATYVTSFTVDQRDHQGQWVDAGSTAVPTSGGSVQIQLTAHGSGSGSMAAGAITLTCHP